MRFICEPGQFTFAIGASWADIRARQVVDLAGDVVEYRQSEIVATAVDVR
jgi:hypothetical protein